MNKQLILLLLLLPLSLAAQSPAQINFSTGDLQQIEARGAREGRPVFLYFTAEWCMPCQWMNKHTFTNTELINLLNNKYFPVKINIDDLRGLREKERYRVKHLPTLLVIDTRGLVIARYEESMRPKQLLLRLREHVTPKPEPAMEAPAVVRPDLAADSPAFGTISRPALVPDRPTTQPAVLGHTPYASLPPSQSNTSQSPTRPATTPAPVTIRHNYGVQVGVFSSYQNTIRQVEYLEKKLDHPVNVFVSEHQSRKVYRILVGVFDNPDAARTYAAQLKRQSIEGMVKDLTDL